MEWQRLLPTIQPYVIGGTFVLMYVAEHVYPQKKDLIDYRHDARNIGIGLLNGVLIFVAGFYFQKWMSWYESSGIGFLNFVTIPLVIRFIIEALLVDCAMYWWHRANHRWPMLWRFHRFHHEDTKLNSTSALRFHACELLLSYVWRLGLFPLLGISISGFTLYSLAFIAVVIFHHSGIRMNKRLDAALRIGIVTPLMHRIHHSIIKKEADSNYGSLFPWWDRVFGSYNGKRDAEVFFGVEEHGSP